MRAVQALLADPKRSQRGSVLSGVLIMVAFLAIISGALMTELSTQFLISRVLVNRVGTEATVNSAIELALNQLQNTALAKGCPGVGPGVPLPSPVTLNLGTASVAYVSCWPTGREAPKYTSIANSAPFSIDGTHSVIPSSQDLYLVGDSGTTVYQFAFGQSSPNWTKVLGSSITGPPLAMQDAGASTVDLTDVANLVPIAGGGGPTGCTASACVEFLGQDIPTSCAGSLCVGHDPDVFCYMAANAPVISRPAAGMAFPIIAYFGSSGSNSTTPGTLYAYSATEGDCTLQSSIATPGNAAIVAGPVVLPNATSDEVYVVTSKGSTSQLLWYEYRSPGSLILRDTVGLPYSTPVGLAVENASVAPRIAITFAGGGVAIVKTNPNFDPTVGPRAVVGGGADAVTDAPFWCSCPAGQQIGVGGVSGTLYVLDTNLNTVASYVGGSPIHTTPSSDGVGEWFFGADDGYIYELQQPPGPPPVAMVRVARYGPAGGLGSVGSSVQVAGCPAGICIYFGSSNNAYIVPLDARDATITACLSSSPPACSGVNPRLWTQVEVGAAGSPQAVHVTGWSYYSP